MLTARYIKENKEKIIQGLQKRKFKGTYDLIESILALDQERKVTKTALDNASVQLKKSASQINELIKKNNQEAIRNAKLQVKSDKILLKKLATQLYVLENELTDILYEVPNIPHAEVPEGSNKNDNIIIDQWGEIPKITAHFLPHWELVEKYDIVDFSLGNKITGAGFPVYKGQGARLQRALINFFLDEAQKNGYDEIQPPIVINEASGYGTGQIPDKEGQMYQLKDENLYLIPTAEIPLTNLYRDTILQENDLPIKQVGYTPCFRKEAGSWGKQVRGLNRLHQFDKVEIVQIQQPEKSYETLQTMCNYVRNLLEQLMLPYRVVKLCSGDLGFTAAFTYDIEVFSAAQNKWLEVSSISNFEAYQAHRMQLRYKDKNNAIHALHTLNGSALALPRVMAALLENNQTQFFPLIFYCLDKFFSFFTLYYSLVLGRIGGYFF